MLMCDSHLWSCQDSYQLDLDDEVDDDDLAEAIQEARIVEQRSAAVWFIDSQQLGELGPSGGRVARRWRHGRRLNLDSRQLKAKGRSYPIDNDGMRHTAYTIMILQSCHPKWEFICRSSTSGPLASYFLLCFRITWKHSKTGFLCKSRPPCRAREKKGCYWCFRGDECRECCAGFYGGQKWIVPCRYMGSLRKEPQDEMEGLLVLRFELRILKKRVLIFGCSMQLRTPMDLIPGSMPMNWLQQFWRRKNDKTCSFFTLCGQLPSTCFLQGRAGRWWWDFGTPPCGTSKTRCSRRTRQRDGSPQRRGHKSAENPKIIHQIKSLNVNW